MNQLEIDIREFCNQYPGFVKGLICRFAVLSDNLIESLLKDEESAKLLLYNNNIKWNKNTFGMVQKIIDVYKTDALQPTSEFEIKMEEDLVYSLVDSLIKSDIWCKYSILKYSIYPRNMNWNEDIVIDLIKNGYVDLQDFPALQMSSTDKLLDYVLEMDSSLGYSPTLDIDSINLLDYLLISNNNKAINITNEKKLKLIEYFEKYFDKFIPWLKTSEKYEEYHSDYQNYILTCYSLYKYYYHLKYNSNSIPSDIKKLFYDSFKSADYSNCDYDSNFTPKSNKALDEARLAISAKVFEEFRDNCNYNEKDVDFKEISSNTFVKWDSQIINEYQDKLDFHNLALNKTIKWNYKLIKEFESKINLKTICRNESLIIDNDLLDEYKDKLDFASILFYNDFIWNEELLIKYIKYFDFRDIVSSSNILWTEYLLDKYYFEILQNKLWSTRSNFEWTKDKVDKYYYLIDFSKVLIPSFYFFERMYKNGDINDVVPYECFDDTYKLLWKSYFKQIVDGDFIKSICDKALINISEEKNNEEEEVNIKRKLQLDEAERKKQYDEDAKYNLYGYGDDDLPF